MENIKEFLNSIGLGKNEAEVYVYLVKEGISSILEVSKGASVHRANVYDAVENLMKAGLVYEINKDKKRLFYARPPTVLLDYVKQKEIELKNIVDQFEITNPKHNPGKIGLSKGKLALKDSIKGLLESEQTVFIYGVSEATHEDLGIILDQFHVERINKKIPLRVIYNSDSQEIVDKLNSMPFTSAKRFPERYNALVSTCISGDRVLMIVWHEDTYVIEIKDESIAKAYQNYFEILWNRARTS